MKQNNNYTPIYAAITGIILSVAALVCALFAPWGVYALIASVLIELVSLAAVRPREKIYGLKGVKIIRIVLYVLLGVSVALFAGGLAYVAAFGKV